MADTDFGRLQALMHADPAAFQKLMAQVAGKTVTPHAGQVPVLESKARFKVMNCGRRFGKTVLAGKVIVSKARKDNQMLWWVAPTYRVVKRGYEEVLRQLPDGVLAHDPPPSTNFDAGRPIVLRFKNGTKMEFYSAERPEGMLGAAVDFVVMDEAAIMPARIWNQIVSPTLIDHMGGALMISTPRGRNWFFQVWLKGQDPEQTEWESWTFTTQDNPTLPPGEADRMAADMPQSEADQEIYAKWLAAGSSVFILDPAVIEHKRVLPSGLVENSDPRGVVYLGIDLARTNDWTVLYGESETRRNVYFERMNSIAWAEQRRRIARAVRTLQRAGAEAVTLMVDEGNAGSVIVEDLADSGFDVVGVNFTTHKANMVRLLANDLEHGKALVLNEQVSEFESYMMAMTAAGRITYSAPEGQHDDVVSSKMLAHWGCVNYGYGQAEAAVVTLTGQGAVRSGDSDADEPLDEPESDDWSDLVDEDEEREAAEAMDVAYRSPNHRPSEQELLARSDLWF